MTRLAVDTYNSQVGTERAAGLGGITSRFAQSTNLTGDRDSFSRIVGRVKAGLVSLLLRDLALALVQFGVVGQMGPLRHIQHHVSRHVGVSGSLSGWEMALSLASLHDEEG